MINLKGKSFLTLLDYTTDEIEYLLSLAHKLKQDKVNGKEIQNLKNKNIVILFQKNSTRTRCAFEVAAFDQGMHVTYLDSQGSQMGTKESIKDTAQVLGRMYDGIEFRGYEQNDVEILAQYSGVPVWNGLTNQYHPTQVLADFMTIQECLSKKLSGIKFVYIGDNQNNVCNSLMIGCAKMGINFVGCGPKQLFPKPQLIAQYEAIAQKTGAKINFTEDINDATSEADVIYTDVWVSMGEKQELWKTRINLLKKYQVTMEIMKNARPTALFLHCLPSFHNQETEIGKEIFKKFDLEALEVTDEVFESKYSVVFDQAENRLHSIKAIMLATLV